MDLTQVVVSCLCASVIGNGLLVLLFLVEQARREALEDDLAAANRRLDELLNPSVPDEVDPATGESRTTYHFDDREEG